MSKVTETAKKIKKAALSRASRWLLLELAAVLLVLTVAMNYVINYVGDAVNASVGFSSWSYVYSDKADAPDNSSATEWSTANVSTPMSHEKTGKYLHMRAHIAPSERERTLQIMTDYAPVRVFIGGEAVYDNHFGEYEMVGNRYNAVVIPSSDADVTVDVSVRLPFSAEVETRLVSGADSPAFAINGGLIFGAVLIVLGIAGAIAAAIIAKLKTKRAYALGAALLAVLYGAAVALGAVSGATYFVNFPQFCAVAFAGEVLLAVVLLLSVKACMRLRSRSLTVLLVLNAVAAIVPTAIINPDRLRWIMSGVLVLTGVTAALTAVKLGHMLSRRIQYANGFYTVAVFFAALNAVSAFMRLSLRHRVDFAGGLLVGEFVLFFIVAFVCCAKAFSGSSARAVELKAITYDHCVKIISDGMRRVLSGADEKEVCRNAADAVLQALHEIFGESDSDNLAFSVLVREDGIYRPLYDRRLDGKVNCRVIESRCIDDGKPRLFDETYFDFVFFKGDDFHIIFHFEGIKNGLSSFFTGVMSVLYGCIEIALDRFSPDIDLEQKKIEVFSRIAGETEIARGNNHDHLECVAYYTALMLRELGYSEHTCELVSLASMLHDIGKAAIPSEITDKSGQLTENERVVIKHHTEYGRQLLSVFDGEFMDCAAVIAGEHHERFDGRGYNRISGENISEFARVVTVADTLDALTTKRVYKDAWPFDSAVSYIDSNSSTMYDPKVVAAMHACIDEIKRKVTEKNK